MGEHLMMWGSILIRKLGNINAGAVICALSLLVMAPATSAQVDSVSASGPQIYTPSDFTQFNPITAEDMVLRIPGFSLQGGESGSRGFGTASLNILINGRRPSSKSSDASEILERIPANTVTRIEILDGASLDIPGLSGQVANIIADSSSVSGTWRYAARFEEGTEPQILEGGLNLTGQKGNIDFVLGVDFGQFTFSEEGPEQFFNGSGQLIEDRTEDLFFRQERPQADLNLTWNRYNGDVAHLNLTGAIRNRNQGNNESFIAVTDAGRTGQSRGVGGEDDYSYEIGGDYASDFNLFGDNGRLKIIGLYSWENEKGKSVFEFQERNQPLQTTQFLRDDIGQELIGRAEYTWKQGERQDWAFGIEGAFNSLESETEFLLNDNIPDCTDPADVNCDFVKVEEIRLDTNLTQSWALNDHINLQTSIAAEYSEISVPSEDLPSRSYFRPKGFISASYTQSPTYTWRARIEREVGQLDFGTFVSTVNLTDNFASQGNDEIVPDQRWSGELELERQDNTGISGTFRAFVDFIDDPIDRIIIRSTDEDGNEIISEGSGNLDSATLYGVEANITWVLDSLGLTGMRLEAQGQLADSRIEDPLTLDVREINSTTLWEYDIELRHDIPDTPYAWEVEVEQVRQSPFFRLDNEFDTRFLRPEARISFIHKELFGMQWTVSATNLFNFRTTRERTIFSPNRLGDIIQTETYDRQRGRRLSISVNDTF
jgi:hypothetical protein